MKAAMAMEKASEANGGAGAGMGLRMPAMFAQYFAGTLPQSEQTEGQPVFNCLDCKNPIAADVNFRPQCGHLRIVYNQCTKCAKNMTPNAKLCSRCGTAVEEMTRTKPCPICGNENLADSMHCIETAISDENIFS
jgi:membrane protease subunit (stomatin/prohibitin family)